MCENVLLLTIFKIIDTIILVAQISLPIIIIVMGSIDLVKCATRGDQDELLKAGKALMYRFIAAVMIFFLPILVRAGMKALITDIDTYNVDCLFNVTDEMIVLAETKNAADAVDYAKENMTFQNYTLAKRYVGRMEESTEKTALESELDKLKAELDAAEKAEKDRILAQAKELDKQRAEEAAHSDNSNLEGGGTLSINGTDQEILNFIQNRYDTIHRNYGASYSGMCGQLTCDQLAYSGLIGGGDRVNYGIDQAAAIARGGQTETGHKVIGYDVSSGNAVSTFEKIISDNDGELENLVISWATGKRAGHVCLVSKISNGKVYLVDNTTIATGSNGDFKATMLSIEEFENFYFNAFTAKYMAHIL